MKQIRQLADSYPTIVGEMLDSIAPVNILLTDIVRRLELKRKPFRGYSAASLEDTESVWNSLHEVDSSLMVNDKHLKASLKSHPAVEEFIMQALLSDQALFFLYQKMWRVFLLYL